ncbi:MAG: 3-deoxy-manno-octulosonate-8-phosphatase, partial [Thalassolituus sp.]
MVHIPNALKEKARAIRLVVFDVDGVLTDGTLTYSASGEEVKHFNVKDGVGIKLLNVFDIDTAIISAKDSAPLQKRAADLGISQFFPGTKDKWAVLSGLMDDLLIDPSEVCYVGDDVIDLKVMTRVGLSVSPADGFWMVRDHADLITEAAGGKGVAR